MPDSSSGRLSKHGRGPKFTLTRKNCRKKAWPYLVKDFGPRCMYSMRHFLQSGEKCIEVDHFNPKLPAAKLNRYQNLMLAARLCNNFKLDRWPTKEEFDEGYRFINPTEEHDYGVQIFEDPETHELRGTTNAAKFHIIMCDLNNASFVRERQLRADCAKMLEGGGQFEGSFDSIEKNLGFARNFVEGSIPPIAAPPPGV